MMPILIQGNLSLQMEHPLVTYPIPIKLHLIITWKVISKNLSPDINLNSIHEMIWFLYMWWVWAIKAAVTVDRAFFNFSITSGRTWLISTTLICYIDWKHISKFRGVCSLNKYMHHYALPCITMHISCIIHSPIFSHFDCTHFT